MKLEEVSLYEYYLPITKSVLHCSNNTGHPFNFKLQFYLSKETDPRHGKFPNKRFYIHILYITIRNSLPN